MPDKTNFDRFVEDLERRDPMFRDRVEQAKRDMFGDDDEDGLAGVRGGRNTVSDKSVCARCKHSRHAHSHYRNGTDCSICSCPRYRRKKWWKK